MPELVEEINRLLDGEIQHDADDAEPCLAEVAEVRRRRGLVRRPRDGYAEVSGVAALHPLQPPRNGIQEGQQGLRGTHPLAARRR